MSMESRIDVLIRAGWRVLDSDFDPVAFLQWRRSAFDCLTAMVGPDHVYTRRFESFLRQGGETDLLAACGIPSAARQRIAGNGLESSGANGGLKFLPD